jgi:hypothetical protein
MLDTKHANDHTESVRRIMYLKFWEEDEGDLGIGHRLPVIRPAQLQTRSEVFAKMPEGRLLLAIVEQATRDKNDCRKTVRDGAYDWFESESRAPWSYLWIKDHFTDEPELEDGFSSEDITGIAGADNVRTRPVRADAENLGGDLARESLDKSLGQATRARLRVERSIATRAGITHEGYKARVALAHGKCDVCDVRPSTERNVRNANNPELYLHPKGDWMLCSDCKGGNG